MHRQETECPGEQRGLSHRLPRQSWLNGEWRREEARYRMPRKLGQPASSFSNQVSRKGRWKGILLLFLFMFWEQCAPGKESSSVDKCPLLMVVWWRGAHGDGW